MLVPYHHHISPSNNLMYLGTTLLILYYHIRNLLQLTMSLTLIFL